MTRMVSTMNRCQKGVDKDQVGVNKDQVDVDNDQEDVDYDQEGIDNNQEGIDNDQEIIDNDQVDVDNFGTVKIKIELLGSGSLGLLNTVPMRIWTPLQKIDFLGKKRERNNGFNRMAKKIKSASWSGLLNNWSVTPYKRYKKWSVILLKESNNGITDITDLRDQVSTHDVQYGHNTTPQIFPLPPIDGNRI